MAFKDMAHASDTALAILKALSEAYLAGRTPYGIILDDVTRECLRELGIGHWTEGPGTWSLFNVPVVEGLMPGWHLRLLPRAAATAA